MWTCLVTVILNLLHSLPSLLYYGCRKIIRRFRYQTPNPISPICNRRILVLIHGRGGHPVDFSPLIQQFHPRVKEDYILFSAHLNNTRNTRIDEDVQALAVQLEPFVDCEITLIGHSKGGIIACRYLALTKDSRISKIITVSSPLLGTKVANYVPFGVVSRDLNYRNSTLEHTQEILQEHSNQLYHIVVEKDHIIIPANSGQYSHTPSEHIFTYTGKYNHGILFDDPIIVQTIQSWL